MQFYFVERETDPVCISMKNVRARWEVAQNLPSNEKANGKSNGKSNGTVNNDQYEHPLTLDNLSIDFLRGKLIGVIGPVGCGKSSLLQAILHELPLESGSMHIDGTVSYANQESWVFAASVRQNILFGEAFDRKRYNNVIKSCALEKDFQQFENGDLSLIMERGASVSGGQKARIKCVNRMLFRCNPMSSTKKILMKF